MYYSRLDLTLQPEERNELKEVNEKCHSDRIAFSMEYLYYDIFRHVACEVGHEVFPVRFLD